MRSFLADGDRISPPGLKKTETRRPAAKAAYRPGHPVASGEAAGGEA